jgi:hypothetical protein
MAALQNGDLDMPIELIRMLSEPDHYIATYRDGELHIIPQAAAGNGEVASEPAPAQAA